MILRIHILSVIVFISSLAFGQNFTMLPDSSGRSHQVSFDADIGFQSNSITNAFAKRIYLGGFIDSSLKEDVTSKLRAQNIIGIESNYSFEYQWAPDTLFGSDHLAMIFGLCQSQYAGFSFSDDLFHTLFYGNKDFLGKTASLGPFNYSTFSYRTLNWGLKDKTTGSKLSMGLVMGSHAQVVDVSLADLYTAPDATYLNLNVKGNTTLSDTSSDAIFNGIGVSTSIQWNFTPGNGATDYGHYSIIISDLGIVVWNNKSLNYSTDTSYNFQGVEIVLGNPSKINTNVSDTLQINYNKGSVVKMLPTLFAIQKTAIYNENSPVQSIFGVNYRLGVQYKPRIFAGLAYIPNKHFGIKTALAFGGYGNSQLDLTGEYNFHNHIVLVLGSHTLISSVLKNGNGMNIIAGLQAYF